jgi:hypothetical protein
VLIAGGPDWLGSPQHVVAGAAIGIVVVVACRLLGLGSLLSVLLAIGATSTAEILVELIEYPLLYSDAFHRSAYWDTLADLVGTLAGGIVGAIAAAYFMRGRGRTRSSAPLLETNE